MIDDQPCLPPAYRRAPAMPFVIPARQLWSGGRLVPIAKTAGHGMQRLKTQPFALTFAVDSLAVLLGWAREF